MPADQDNAEELLATIAQQVAQASRTTALHIEHHDDIEKAAQEKAGVVISKVRETLETAHQSALDQATEALKSSHNQELHTNLTTIAKKFNETLDDLVRHHRSTLQEHIETLKKADEERAESHSQEMDRVRNAVQRAEDQTQAQRKGNEDSHREALAQTANTLERERKPGMSDTSNSVLTQQQEWKKSWPAPWRKAPRPTRPSLPRQGKP